MLSLLFRLIVSVAVLSCRVAFRLGRMTGGIIWAILARVLARSSAQQGSAAARRQAWRLRWPAGLSPAAWRPRGKADRSTEAPEAWPFKPFPPAHRPAQSRPHAQRSVRR